MSAHRRATGPSWREAEQVACALAARDAEALGLVARLPLATAALLHPLLAGAASPSGVYRSLGRLVVAGLVAASRPSFRAGLSPRLLYATDLGLAALALRLGHDPVALARAWGTRGRDLHTALPALAHLHGAYALLGALARLRTGSTAAGAPDLLAWERPWRRGYRRPGARTSSIARLPAAAALGWADGSHAAALLVPDLGTIPLRAYRPALAHLIALRALRGDEPPLLLVATTGLRRADAWVWLAEEVCRTRGEAPLPLRVLSWHALEAMGGSLQPMSTDATGRGSAWVLPAQQDGPLVPPAPAWEPPPADRPIPELVGRLSGGSAGYPIVLAPSDRLLLDLLGRHPFLPPRDLAAVLGWTVRTAARRLERLVTGGLTRRLAAGETGAPDVAEGHTELTRAGLRLLAGQLGLGLAAAVRHHGLAGGGPERPVGARRQLLQHLSHTRGADGVFVRFCLGAGPTGQRLVEWRNAATCARGAVRPDGYGLLRGADGRLQGFFLEYDRGTMRGRAYRRKFAAYAAYRDSGRYRRDYDGFPTILVVTTGPGAEARIAQAVRMAGAGREPLAVLLSTTGWIEGHPEGLRGPIWRDPSGTDRCRWPEDLPKANPR